MFLSKLLTRKHWQIAVWLLRPRTKCIYVLENMLRDEYDVSIDKKLYDKENNKIIIFVPCSKCIARNLFVAAMLLSIRLGVS